MRLFGASLILFLFAVGQPSHSIFSEQLRIVAVVNDEVITQAELDQALAPVYFQMQAALGPEQLAREMEMAKRQVLEKLIEAKVMLQEARDPRPVEISKGKIGTPLPIEVSEGEVEEMLGEAKAQFRGPKTFEEGLKRQGMTLELVRKRFRDQIIIQKLIGREVRSRVSVSPAEVTTYYQTHPEDFKVPAAVQVATILIRPEDSLDEDRAKKLIRKLETRLAHGEGFYDLAKRYSDGLNAQMGGRIGYLEKGKSLPEIERVLFRLDAGAISPIIRSPAGFHLFFIESIRAARQAELDEVKGRIRQFLREKRVQERFQEWIGKLKADSYIAIK